MALQTRDPSQAIITSVGSAINGGTTHDLLPVITGTADAGNTIYVYDRARFLGTTTAAVDGVWSFTPAVAIKAGFHKFAVIPQDSENNWGESSPEFAVTIDLPPVTPPVITGLSGDNGLSIAPGSTTTELHPKATGTGQPGDTVTLFDGQQAIGSAVVDAAGKWSVTPAKNLVDGTHDLYAIASNAAGSYSAPSNHEAFTIDTSTPVAPVITEVMDNFGPVQGPVPRNGTTDDVRPVISGTGKAGYIINLYDNGTLMATTQVDANGTWSIQPAQPLPSSVHDLIAIQTDTAGNGGMISAHFGFLIGPTPSLVSSSHDSALQDTAHIDSAHDSNNVLHAKGLHTAIDSMPVVGKPTTAESAGVEKIDVNAQHNTLKLSLVDVLNLAERDLFQNEDKHPTRMDAKTSDSIESPHTHVAGLVEGEWQLHGASVASGAAHHPAGHSSALAEQLAQQGVELAMH